MTSINPADQLAAIIRAQVSAVRARGRSSTGSVGKQRAVGARAAARQDPAQLAADRIRKLDPDDPGKQGKALRIFLECAIAAELGESVMADPAFEQMIQHVVDHLQSDPDLSAASAEAAAWLVRAASAA